MFVTDVIRDDYKKWSCGDTVIIHAQTGAGKTYFVLQELLPFVAEHGKKLLYLSNRTALRDQIKMSYPNKFDDVIVVDNYQSFEREDFIRRNLSDKEKNFLSCEYWVMDEGHYFLADGPFNSNVLSCMINISAEKKKRVLIFMTATPQYLFLALGSIGFFSQKPPNGIYASVGSNSTLLYQMSSPTNLLKFKETNDYTYQNHKRYLDVMNSTKSWVWVNNISYVASYKDPIPKDIFREKFQKYSDYIEQVSKEVIHYKANSEYGYVKPVYFKTLIQLCEQIEKTSKQEKWLLFVSSKKKGEDIKNYLQIKGVDSVMITSETKYHKKGLGGLVPKEYEVYNSIINECKSSVRVTIATSVLDNGVNLKDPALKHLAILEMNPTTFLQMLGRKRLESMEEQINLYLQSKDTGEIKAYFERSILQYVRFLVELQTVGIEADAAEWKNDEKVLIILTKFQEKYQANGSFRSPFNYYVREKTSTLRKQQKNFIDGPYLCLFFEPNPVTSVRLMYDYYRMLALLESYENTPEELKKVQKEILWIEHQLSWMGLEYDPSCWIDYGQHLAAKKNLELILSENEGQALSKPTQEQLKKAIITVVNTSHPPMDTKIGKASKEKVNAALAELGYLQRIQSKNRSIKGKQRNYWHIIQDNEAN